MTLEIEAKLQVPSHEPVRQALLDASAVPLARVAESNHIFDTADHALGDAGSALRLRVNEPLDGGPSAATLTYKGPVLAGALKRRQEIEITVGQADRALELLAALGYVEVMAYHKRRDSYRLDECRVELDQVPLLGRFVEIEGPTEEAIARVQQRIGLADLPHQPASYVALLMDYCNRTGCDPRNIDFPAA